MLRDQHVSITTCPCTQAASKLVVMVWEEVSQARLPKRTLLNMHKYYVLHQKWWGAYLHGRISCIYFYIDFHISPSFLQVCSFSYPFFPQYLFSPVNHFSTSKGTHKYGGPTIVGNGICEGSPTDFQELGFVAKKGHFSLVFHQSTTMSTKCFKTAFRSLTIVYLFFFR